MKNKTKQKKEMSLTLDIFLRQFFSKYHFSVHIFCFIMFFPMNASIFLLAFSLFEPRNNLVVYGFAVKNS